MVASFQHALRVSLGVCLFLAAAKGTDAGNAANKTANPAHSATAVLSASSPLSISASTDVLSVTPDAIDSVFSALQRHWDRKPGEQTLPNPESEPLPLSSDPSLVQFMGRMLISLAFVIMLGLGVAWIARRFFVKSHSLGGGYIERLGSFTLSQKSKVHLIRVGDHHFLVGEGGNSLSLIAEVDLHTAPVLSPHGLEGPSEEIPLPPRIDSSTFQSQLSQWQNSLENRNLRQELNASLLFMKGLTQRLRRKGERNA